MFLRALALAVLLLAPAGCRTGKDNKSDGETAAAMRDMRKELIEQMKTSGATPAQIREMQRQMDLMEKQMKQLERQMEQMDKSNP